MRWCESAWLTGGFAHRVRLVTADGKIRPLTPQSTGLDGELYWACRGGGGGNFGVNTSFSLSTFAAEPQNDVHQVAASQRIGSR